MKKEKDDYYISKIMKAKNIKREAAEEIYWGMHSIGIAIVKLLDNLEDSDNQNSN